MIIVSKPAWKPILKAFLIWHLYCVQSTPNAIAPADKVAISALNIFNTESVPNTISNTFREFPNWRVSELMLARTQISPV